MRVTIDLQEVFGLTGKRALVTGGATGIGRGIAECLIAAGADVMIAGRREEVLAKSASEMGCRYAVLDVLDVEGHEAFDARIAEGFGAIDILVNNAGNTHKHPFVDTHVEDFDRVFNVHVRGALELTRPILRRQIAQGSGRILFVASMTSFIAQPNVLAYTVAKTALTGAVRALSAEAAGHNVRINAIAPGWIDTILFRQATDSDPDRKAKIMGRIQTGTLGTPEDIGWAAVYLAARAGDYVTGQTLIVDGGGVIGF